MVSDVYAGECALIIADFIHICAKISEKNVVNFFYESDVKSRIKARRWSTYLC